MQNPLIIFKKQPIIQSDEIRISKNKMLQGIILMRFVKWQRDNLRKQVDDLQKENATLRQQVQQFENQLQINQKKEEKKESKPETKSKDKSHKSTAQKLSRNHVSHQHSDLVFDIPPLHRKQTRQLRNYIRKRTQV
jgi:regulator of replication initiation timing